METLTSPAISAELFVVPLETGRHLVYEPLRQAAFVANATTINLIARLKDNQPINDDDETKALLDFLRRMEIVDGGAEPRPITTYSGTPRPTSVSLFLTTACNLRCTYCYAAAGDTPKRVMRPEVAIRGIDYVIANAVALGVPSIEVNYHGGGEPSVNWRTLTESFSHARRCCDEHGLRLEASMATNGFMSDSRIDWVVANLSGVSLSFDGIPEAHDAHRLTVAGQGSSDKVIHTLRRFDAAGFNYGIRVTVTRDNIPHMEQSIRFVCENFLPRRIQVEPAYQLGRWREAPSAETEAFIAGFRAAQAAARQAGQEIYFSAARVGLLSNHFCGVTQDSFCLTANGEVSGCYETFIPENEFSSTFFYGREDKQSGGYTFNLPVLQNLRNQSVENRPFCQGCFAKWTCGGDCHHKALAVNGSGEFAGTDRCHIIRELTTDQVLQNISASGGLFWHQPLQESMQAKGKEIFL